MSNSDDVWYLPRMKRRHWGLVLFIVLLQFSQTRMSIAGLVGSIFGAVIFVYVLLIIWSGIRNYHQKAVDDVS